MATHGFRQAGAQFFIGAAEHRQLLLMAQLICQFPGQFLHGAAAHAAAHHQQVGGVCRNSQRGLGFGLVHSLLESGLYRQPQRMQLFSGDALPEEGFCQRCIRDEISIQIAFGQAGTTGIVRCHEGTDDGRRIALLHPRPDQRGEHMGGDHAVKAALHRVLVELVRSRSEKTVQGAAGRKGGIVLFCVGVACPGNAGKMAVERIMPLFHQAGDGGGEESEDILDFAVYLPGCQLGL